jgi:hypothetical protein
VTNAVPGERRFCWVPGKLARRRRPRLAQNFTVISWTGTAAPRQRNPAHRWTPAATVDNRITFCCGRFFLIQECTGSARIELRDNPGR